MRVLGLITALVLTNCYTSDVSRPTEDCKAKLEWIFIEYTDGDVGSDHWGWRAKGSISGSSTGIQTVPAPAEEDASLQPGGSFNPNILLASYAGEKLDDLNVEITFAAKEVDPGGPLPLADASNEGKIKLSIPCRDANTALMTGEVTIKDVGGEDVGTPGAVATLTYKFLLSWDPP